MSGTTTPLLDQSGYLPKFGEITEDQVVPGITSLVEDLEAKFSEFETNLATTPTTYANVVEELEKMSGALEYSWGVVSHLNGKDSWHDRAPDALNFKFNVFTTSPLS